MKKRATAVIIVPEYEEAQVRSPIPNAASENPHTAPNMTTMPKKVLELFLSILFSLLFKFISPIGEQS
jgi:hypothetical protein